MFKLFQSTPVIPETESQWLFDAYAWALHHFQPELFYQHTQLVLPTNQFFPGRVDNAHAMAQLIFDRVKQYACVSHWPTHIEDQQSCSVLTAPQITIEGSIRDQQLSVAPSVNQESCLQIPYNPQQISNPEGMIASFAHTLAHYLGQMADQPPPGGADYWPHVTELLAIYMGFGLMFANSAFTFRGGCGSCYNPNANRDAYLSEFQSVYALAIFSVLKNIPSSEVTRHLKGHLKSVYRKAVKEITQRQSELTSLSSDAVISLPA